MFDNLAIFPFIWLNNSTTKLAGLPEKKEDSLSMRIYIIFSRKEFRDFVDWLILNVVTKLNPHTINFLRD